MRSIIAIPAAALLALVAFCSDGHAAGPAGRSQFRWKDAAGIPHYSDMLTVEALQFGYDILNANGAVIKHVDRQHTPEELFAEEAAAQAAATAKREADAQALTDQRMLTAFPTEKEFTAARQAQLDSIEQNMRSANNSLGVQERSLSDTLARAASFEHDGKPVPDTVQKQIESLRKSADALHAYILRRQKEKADATARFDVDLAHYRSARESGAKP